jgi:preprotein translocase subunit SecG
MTIAITVVHVLTCFFLVVVVLLQTGKGADMGAVFGGGSSTTLFGSSGAGNLLTKATTAAAVVFMMTSLFLAYSASHQSPVTIFDRTAVDAVPVATPLPEGIDTAAGSGEVGTTAGAADTAAAVTDQPADGGARAGEPAAAPVGTPAEQP